jgi:hypothetical protein
VNGQSSTSNILRVKIYNQISILLKTTWKHMSRPRNQTWLE